jgi:hypothetical protein
MSVPAKRAGTPLRIVLDAYVVQYPLGGVVSYALQFLAGFRDLGHDVYLLEKSPGPQSCYDPRSDTMTDDARPALAWLRPLFQRFRVGDRWCYVDAAGDYHGMSRRQVDEVLRSTDVFLNIGTHGYWKDEVGRSTCRVLLDGEPGFRQMKMELARTAGEDLPEYDRYFTDGLNIGTPSTRAPSAGLNWGIMPPPVRVDAIEPTPAARRGRFTTVMNWESHKPLVFQDRRYGQKAEEFERFMDLPRRTRAPLEVAVSGRRVPVERLKRYGWSLRSANAVSASADGYWRYIRASRGEFSVAKNVFVVTRCGMFSERSAMYLAHGRPVVVQDTGFSDHLPCGRGLFAVRDADEAAQALDEIEGDYACHSAAAREIAVAHFDARKVLRRFLDDLTA